MKNFYSILNVKPNASTKDIKKVYQILALSRYPDKGGIDEAVKELNEAYKILQDPTTRADCDLNWSIFQSIDNEDVSHTAPVGYISVTNGLSFSYSYKQEYTKLVELEMIKGVKLSSARAKLASFKSTV